ncbi:hypothetical protein CAPTEDRAFT_206893 [Capitella teleta]|uniref:Uncharacterized protein n=1 Tax=Capitella teleta TaxID=283909 RepID=R7UGB6_CAPTE|nr:hypothetical protein CAPTEDRAFT_206893 [Capitella teleta]|eukprot:ELU05265.1 hypothetical protein CAPTEDRAFT_206893 [Capitella teleta]
MAAFLILIAFLVFVFGLVSNSLSDVSKWCCHLFLASDPRREEMKLLTKELTTINMANEFVRYARIERKINKLKTGIAETSKKNAQSALIVKVVVYSLFNIIRVVSFIYLIISYRYEPVLELPTDWLSPFGYFLSLPIGSTGCISLFVWIATCRAVMNTGLEVFLSS